MLKRISKNIWEIPMSYKKGMRVPARIYATEELIKNLDEGVIEQATNVATLPGIQKFSLVMPDAHRGYGFAIGGVAAFDENEGGVISPGGIGYDINCLSPSTEILTDFGYTLKISSLKNREEALRIFNIKKKSNDSSQILFLAEREIQKDEKVLEIKTKFGRKIECSEEHPLLTANGYLKAGKLNEGNKIVVYPFEGIDYSEPEGKLILAEEDFEGQNKMVIKILEEKGILPLRLNNPRIGLLARILGFCLGDGCICRIVSRERTRHLTHFYGKEKDLETLRKDIMKLGFTPSKIYSRKRKIKIKTAWNKEYNSLCWDNMIRVSSESFAILLNKLGMPIGKKISSEFVIPDWIREAPLWIKRNFLAGLFGADGSACIVKGYTPLPISLTLTKEKKLEKNALRFLKEIKNLLNEFGIKKVVIYKIKSGEGRTCYRLSIIGEEDIYLFLSRIGYEYSKEKKEKGLWVAEYLRRKKIVKRIRKDVVERAKEVYYNTGSLSKAVSVAKKEYTNQRLIERHLYSSPKEMRIAHSFEKFDGFLKKFCLKGGFVLDEVVEIKEIKPSYSKLYDVGVKHEAHNFIANNIVVHNCGVRILRTNLTIREVRPKLKELIETLFKNVPAGVGARGAIERLDNKTLDEVMEEGVGWCLREGYATEKDKEHCEDYGCLEGANPEKISAKARERGRDQLGTLGSGNHFLEIQEVTDIFDEEACRAMGIFEPGQICVMIHCGSRGFGHQVATDYLRIMERAMHKYKIPLIDRELMCAPIQSEEGQSYWQAMCCAANISFANRQVITYLVRKSFEKVFKEDWESLGIELIYDVCHNIGKKEEHEVDGKKKLLYVHRKGATRALPKGHELLPKAYKTIGQPVLIPGAMGTESYVCIGMEKAKETFYSSCHGAGRVMSRTKAKKMYRGERIKRELEGKGIIVRAKSMPGLAEEVANAYKNVSEVVKAVVEAGLVKLGFRLFSRGNIKG